MERVRKDLSWFVCFSVSSVLNKKPTLYFVHWTEDVFKLYCDESSDRFGFCRFSNGNPPPPPLVVRGLTHLFWTMTPASRGDGHQESYDANVSHFVLHTSSLISLLSCSVQAGSAQHRFRERWRSLQIICTNIVCLHHPPSFFFFLSVSLLAPLVWLFLFLLSLSVLLHLCFSHWALSLSLSLSVLQEEVGCHVDVVIWSSECLEGINPGKTHFHQPCNLWDKKK